MKTNAFSRYAPFIQKFIYQKGWDDLRDVQMEACDVLLDTDKHVIIASGTASGKTEAAFFPVLTLLEKNPSSSVGVIYIGPLKALINDQFERLEELLKDNNIPVWPWHGDVPQSVKNKAMKSASGILQITPESLEAMIMRHPEEAKSLFHDLRFVIIDEIHALMGSDRGLQVLCLLQRMEHLTNCHPRRIGLSATLHDYQPAMEFLSMGSLCRHVIAVGIKSKPRKISIGIKVFEDNDEPDSDDCSQAYSDFIYNACHNKKCLIFANSRKNTESIIATMKEIAKSRNERDVFYVHHGSVSALLRKEVEHKMRDTSEPVVIAATLTLELGIDIGDLDMTIQLGAPPSCSSFVQRMGRSGRRSGKSTMLFVDTYTPNSTTPLSSLPWNFLQILAILQLYIEEKWVEPFEMKQKPFSLLAHQTLSIVTSYTEIAPIDLAKMVLNLAVFKGRVKPEEYKELLTYMIKEEYLELVDGKLIVGLKGEKIISHYSFYATFESNEGYHVISEKNGSEIGTVDRLPEAGSFFVLAGKAWHVTDLDEAKKKIFVVPAGHIKFPSWFGSGIDINERIVQKMRQILQEDTEYSYLQPNERNVLSQIRSEIRKTSILADGTIPLNEHSFLLCPWCGSKTLNTVSRLLNIKYKKALKIRNVLVYKFYLEIESELKYSEFVDKLKTLTLDFSDSNSVLQSDDCPSVDKYDYMVPGTLRRTAFFYNETDVKAAYNVLTTSGS